MAKPCPLVKVMLAKSPGAVAAASSYQAFGAQGRVAESLNGGDGLILYVETDPDLGSNVGGDASDEGEDREELGDQPGSLPARHAPRAAASPPQAKFDQAFVAQGCAADGLNGGDDLLLDEYSLGGNVGKDASVGDDNREELGD